MQNIRSHHYAAHFSAGVEADPPLSLAERKRQRAETLCESPGRTLARICADLTHALSPRSLPGLPGTLDFLIREKGIGAASLPDPLGARRLPDGLAGIAADLSPPALLDAYSRGLFLRFMLGQPAFWTPQMRMAADPARARGPDNLAARIEAAGYRITLDREFDSIVNAAAADAIARRLPYAPNTRGMSAFAALHDAGFAHSVEVRDRDGALAGGLYGVACGTLFVIQSRFGVTPETADLAIAVLNSHLASWGYTLVDGCADVSLADCGFAEIAREAFLTRLPGSLSGGQPGRWLLSPAVLQN